MMGNHRDDSSDSFNQWVGNCYPHLSPAQTVNSSALCCSGFQPLSTSAEFSICKATGQVSNLSRQRDRGQAWGGGRKEQVS